MNLENKYHVFAVINVLISKQIKLLNKDDDRSLKIQAEVFAVLMSSLLTHLCVDEDPEDVMAKVSAEKKKFMETMSGWLDMDKSVNTKTARS